MTSKHRAFWLPATALLAMAVFLTVAVEKSAALFEPQLGPCSLEQDGVTGKVSLPHYKNSTKAGQIYRYRLTVRSGTWGSSKLHIIPDDHLAGVAVNGKELDLARAVVSGSRSDWQNGVLVNLGSSLVAGTNTVDIRVQDNGGGRFGLDIRPPVFYKNPLRLSAWIACVLSWLALLAFVLRHRKTPWLLVTMIVTALFLHLLSLSVRNYTSYSYDLYEGNSGQANYVLYIAEKMALPGPDKGWSYYHPPLYHISAAAVYKAAQALEIGDPFKPLQVLSLAYYWGFIAFALLLLRRFVTHPLAFHLSAMLLLFWPSGFINGFRVGNDAAFYFWFAGALYFGHKWFIGGAKRDILWSVAFSSLGFVTKTNLAPLIGVQIALIGFRWFKKSCPALNLRVLAAIGTMFLASFLASTADNYYYAIKNGKKDWYLAGIFNLDFQMDKRLYSENHIANYIAPDMDRWFRSPYIDSRDDATGRANYWNYLFKSSMFGEFSFTTPVKKNTLAPAMSFLLVPLLILALAGTVSLLRRRRNLRRARSGVPSMYPLPSNRASLRRLAWKQVRTASTRVQEDYRFVFACLVLLLVALFGSRANQLTPCLNDFRYVQPVLAGIVIGCGIGLERIMPRRLTAVLCVTAACLFCVVSGIFYFGI